MSAYDNDYWPGDPIPLEFLPDDVYVLIKKPVRTHKMTSGKYIIRKARPIEYDTQAEALNVAKDYAGGLAEWKVVRVK